MPFKPLSGPLLTGGHCFARCLSLSASASACGNFAILPCTTYSCSARASASSTWWLSSSVSLGTTMIGTATRRASRIEPEPVRWCQYAVRKATIADSSESYRHAKSPLPRPRLSHPSHGACAFPIQACRGQSQRWSFSTKLARLLCTCRTIAFHLGRIVRSIRCILAIRVR